MDEAARKRVQELIKANREATMEKLKAEGKTAGMGMYTSMPRSPGFSQGKQKKKENDFEEVFDHLEEPNFDPEEMQRTAELLR